MPRFVAGLIAALAALALAAPAASADVFDGAVWTEETLESTDGTKLHADILRDADAPEDQRQPVILSVSPYTLHESGGPSSRFYDFLEASGALEEGYTYVMVTLRSFGESEGCSDWGGPGEQGDVVAAVEWASKAPWSTGQVGLFGKSYDGWTGLMGIANRAKGLEAVLSMEPVYDGYRYLYENGVRFINSALTPTSFMTESQPRCAAEYVLEQQDDNGDSAFWQARELIKKSRGAKTPLFLTQGFLESNTKPDGAFDYWSGIAGPKRAWFGQFNHVRGYEMLGGEFAVGRDGFIDESMDFFDAFLKDDPAARKRFEKAPPVEVQDSLGRYRAEQDWPPADSVRRQTTLLEGAYHDNGANLATGTGGGQGSWSISQQMAQPVHLAGEPVIDADIITAAPRANFVANVYDIAPNGRAVLVSRGARLVRMPGAQTVRLQMYGADWVFEKDHRIGVLLSGANQGWWVNVPTMAPVVVAKAFATLPLLDEERTEFLSGQATSRLREVKNQTISVPAQVISTFQTPFHVGPANRAASGKKARKGRKARRHARSTRTR